MKILEDTANLAVDFPFNPTLWYSVEFERLVTNARSTFNDTQRQALLDQAQAIAYEEAPWIWLRRPYDFYSVASWLDWKPRPDGLIYLYKAKASS
jgi:peptide/nickel transport system substrate-binding protein